MNATRGDGNNASLADKQLLDGRTASSTTYRYTRMASVRSTPLKVGTVERSNPALELVLAEPDGIEICNGSDIFIPGPEQLLGRIEGESRYKTRRRIGCWAGESYPCGLHRPCQLNGTSSSDCTKRTSCQSASIALGRAVGQALLRKDYECRIWAR